MNFKNKKAHGPAGHRKKSSDYRYPQVERGNSQRATHSTAVKAASASDEMQWADPEAADELWHKWGREYDDFMPDSFLDTEQFVSKPKPKAKPSRAERAARRVRRAAANAQWHEWWAEVIEKQRAREARLAEEKRQREEMLRPPDPGKPPALVPRRKK